MLLRRLRVSGFRNLRHVDVSPNPALTILHGENAQGKTNLIEAVHVLANLQSFRTVKNRDLISFEGSQAHLQGQVETNGGEARLDVSIEIGGRSARLNEKVPDTTAAYLAAFQTILFSPLDLDLARGNQDRRRRLLDRAAFLRDPIHLLRHRKYQRVLRQRNALLRHGGEGLDVWDDRWIEAALPIYRARRDAYADFAGFVSSVHEEISGGREDLVLALAFCDDPEELKEKLRRSREREKRVGYTTIGPHRQKVEMAIGGKKLESHASQGQMRTAALSLKLGLLRYANAVLGEDPLFLLDDPGSELDAGRLEFLGTFLAAWSGQVIVSSTERDSVPLPKDTDRTYLQIARGEIRSRD